MRRDKRIREVMRPGVWYMTSEIARLTGMQVNIVSATLYTMNKYDEVEAIRISYHHSSWRLREAERWRI